MEPKEEHTASPHNNQIVFWPREAEGASSGTVAYTQPRKPHRQVPPLGPTRKVKIFHPDAS